MTEGYDSPMTHPALRRTGGDSFHMEGAKAERVELAKRAAEKGRDLELRFGRSGWEDVATGRRALWLVNALCLSSIALSPVAALRPPPAVPAALNQPAPLFAFAVLFLYDDTVVEPCSG